MGLHRITQKCMVTYFTPYSSVTLSKMAKTFHKTEDEMEDLVETLLLQSTDSNLRIDSKEKVIRHILPPIDLQRKLVRKKVTQMLSDFQTMTTSMMLRVSCLE